ncbi:hypothetical protein F5H01DRAFT_329106 [Linnemannia elongata]|nr:hypothetical protein F5H01DRAFT_329106 [Linnemannia elongata]
MGSFLQLPTVAFIFHTSWSFNMVATKRSTLMKQTKKRGPRTRSTSHFHFPFVIASTQRCVQLAPSFSPFSFFVMNQRK